MDRIRNPAKKSEIKIRKIKMLRIRLCTHMPLSGRWWTVAPHSYPVEGVGGGHKQELGCGRQALDLLAVLQRHNLKDI